jgi:hypothetical protein
MNQDPKTTASSGAQKTTYGEGTKPRFNANAARAGAAAMTGAGNWPMKKIAWIGAGAMLAWFTYKNYTPKDTSMQIHKNIRADNAQHQQQQVPAKRDSV